MTTSPAASDAAAPVQDRFDPAQQSLADALRVSFWVLRAFMALLLVLYLFSGVFNVREQEKAVRLRFGRILGPPGEQVLEPGGPYFSLPYPFSQIVRMPVSPQQIHIDTAFWYELSDRGSMTGRPGPLNPEKDGSLVTGNAEVVHARWSVTYTVKDPIRYLENVRDSESARRLVAAVAEQCVVWAAAGMNADALIRSQNLGRAGRRAEAVLDGLGCGISITTFSITEAVYPLSVHPAVQHAINAESMRAKLIDQAQEQWNRLLVGVAGEASEPLLAMIDAYELASHAGDAQRVSELERLLDDGFTRLAVEADRRQISIGGEVAQSIHAARAYRTQVVARIRGEAEYFDSLLPRYRENRKILLNRLWQDAKDRILTGDIETMYTPAGQTHLELNRDPRIQRDREQRKLTNQEPGANAGR